MRKYLLPFLIAGQILPHVHAAPLECEDWSTKHPSWLWCDDFEVDGDLEHNYFEVNRADGRFGVVAGEAKGGTAALRSTWQPGKSESGNIKFSFGATPVAPTRYTDQHFKEIYWRFYFKTDDRWTGQGNKVTRITSFAGSNWSQAMIAHVWQGNTLNLAIDPASGIASGLSSTNVITQRYNDFDTLRWLGNIQGSKEVYANENKTIWKCLETKVKLNSPGNADGEFKIWIDGQLDAEKNNLNFIGSYTKYGLNAIFLENYMGGGSPQEQYRYYDNLVVSTKPIGCIDSPPVKPVYPPNMTVEEKLETTSE